jgi:hypothetical protein
MEGSNRKEIRRTGSRIESEKGMESGKNRMSEMRGMRGKRKEYSSFRKKI